MASTQTNSRPESTPVETEKRELEWWQLYAELEQRFTWVQTPQMQRILRGRYVGEIVKSAGAKGRILELGCGMGWLCLVLAEAGASEVSGVDFSPAQIAIAQDCAQAAGLAGRVHFHCADGTQEGNAADAYDCVVVHAFLHHLNKFELRRTLAGIPRLLKPDGTFVVFEPVLREDNPDQPVSTWQNLQRELVKFAKRGQRMGLRKISPEEKRWRDLFDKRKWGVPPHGPSPKEMPFAQGELESYLEPHFVVERQEVCMAMSHLVTHEWLLRELSHPRSTGLLLPWVARLTAWLDRKMVAQREPMVGLWAFTMFVCRPRPQSAQK